MFPLQYLNFKFTLINLHLLLHFNNQSILNIQSILIKFKYLVYKI